MSWDQFLTNYLSSVAAGITLAIFGGFSYLVYVKRIKQSQNVDQKTMQGQNIAVGQASQVNINISSTPTTKEDKEITKKLG